MDACFQDWQYSGVQELQTDNFDNVDKVFEQLLRKKAPEKLDHSLFQPKHATMFDWGLETRINGKEFVRILNNQHIASIRRENIHGREERKISGHGLDYFQR